MAKKTIEEAETEAFLRMQTDQSIQWQQSITADEDLEKWVSDGHWDFLKRKLFDELEMEIFQTIKASAFDPSNVVQVTQFKALCQLKDLIEAKISSRLSAVRDARTKLKDLENSTQLKEGE